MVPLCRGGRLCPPIAGLPPLSVGRDPCVPPHDMHVFLPAGHAGPALQGTGRVRADRVVRPYSGSRSRAKRDVGDAVPYTCVSAAHRSPVKAMDFASCRWQRHRIVRRGEARRRRRTVCTSSRRNKVPACETRFYFVGRMRFNISISPSRYVLAARLRS